MARIVNNNAMPEFEEATDEAVGVLELHKDRSGWLRQAKNSYTPAEEPDEDVFVPTEENVRESTLVSVLRAMPTEITRD